MKHPYLFTYPLLGAFIIRLICVSKNGRGNYHRYHAEDNDTYRIFVLVLKIKIFVPLLQLPLLLPAVTGNVRLKR